MKKIIYVILVIGLFYQSSVKAQSTLAQAQSHFIYNFTRFLDWPLECKSGDFVIGVYGNSDVYDELKQYVLDKTVNLQQIKVKFITNLDDAAKCHILFVGESKSREISAIKQKLGQSKTCIISEKEGSIQDGAAINFVLVDNKLKYEVNTTTIQREGLKYSSTLVTMAANK